MVDKSIDIIKAPKGSLPKESPKEQNKNKEDDLTPKGPRRDFSNFYLGLGIVSVLILLGFSGYLLFTGALGGGGEGQEAKETTKESQEATSKEPFTELEESEGTTQEETLSAETTQPSQEALIDKASVRIKVANGNGRTGEAAAMRNILVQEGYSNKIDVGNAQRRYQTTIIYYAPGKEKEGVEIEKAVARKYQTSLMESKTVVGNIYDVVVALGIK